MIKHFLSDMARYALAGAFMLGWGALVMTALLYHPSWEARAASPPESKIVEARGPLTARERYVLSHIQVICTNGGGYGHWEGDQYILQVVPAQQGSCDGHCGLHYTTGEPVNDR